MPSATVECRPPSLVGFLATNGTLSFVNFVHSMWVGNSRRWSRIWRPKSFLAWLGRVFALEKLVNAHPQTAAHMWYAIFFVWSHGNLNEVGDWWNVLDASVAVADDVTFVDSQSWSWSCVISSLLEAFTWIRFTISLRIFTILKILFFYRVLY